MPTPSPLTTAVFCGVVLLVALALGYGGRRAGLGALPLLLILLAYLVIPALLARRGALDRYNPLPAPALLVLLGLTGLTVIIAFSRWGGRLAAGIPLVMIVALQAFRIPVELTLHRLYVEGVVPVQMTYTGRNLDIISGLTALALGGWLLSGRRAYSAVLWGWNVLGLMLLANIVIVALLSTPVPFRRFTEGPPNLLPSTFPFIWLPSFLVQVALGSHLLVFRQLRSRRTESAQSTS
jgi:hypothetical protein